MFVKHEFYVGLRDINKNQKLTNTSLLSYFEDVACMHSEIAGFGVSNMNVIKKTWILLSWKIKVLKRPKFNDVVKIETWSRAINKFYAFRDFRMYNEKNELIGIATSKWVFIDIEKEKMIRITDEVASKYEQEPDANFEEFDLEKLSAPEEYISKIDYKITKNMIDINNHLHNTYYMDLAQEVLTDNKEFNYFEIMYKHEIKLGETVKVMCSKQEDNIYVVIKNFDETKVHAILKFN